MDTRFRATQQTGRFSEADAVGHECSGLGDLLSGQSQWPAQACTTGTGCLQPRPGAFDSQLALQLREDQAHLDRRVAHRCGRIRLLPEGDHSHADLVEASQEVEGRDRATSESGQLSDQQRVALT